MVTILPTIPPRAMDERGRFIEGLHRRIRAPEGIIGEKNVKLEVNENKLHKANYDHFKTSIDMDKLLRYIKKGQMLHENTKLRLAMAIQVLEKRDKEIAEIKKLNLHLVSLLLTSRLGDIHKIQKDPQEEDLQI